MSAYVGYPGYDGALCHCRECDYVPPVCEICERADAVIEHAGFQVCDRCCDRLLDAEVAAV